MTFIAPSRPVWAFGSAMRSVRPARTRGSASRAGLLEQQGARQAFGSDSDLPIPVVRGRSLEDLARIALG